jgi:hypothetical protein
MKRKTLLAAVLLLGLAITLLLGCGEEEDEITGNGGGLLIGDTLAPEFQFVSEFLGEGSMEFVFHSLEMTMVLVDSIPGGGAPAKAGQPASLMPQEESLIVESYTYTYANFWHIFAFEAIVVDELTSDTIVDVSGIDSFQVLVNGDPVQYPGPLFNGLNIRSHFDWMESSGFASGHSDHSLNLTAAPVGIDTAITITGSVYDSLGMYVSDGQTQCLLDMAIELTLSELTFIGFMDECPTAGSASSTVRLDLSCEGGGSGYDSLNVNGTWTMTATVSGDVITVSYSDGTTSWTVSGPCDEPATSPSRAWPTRR